ncbi:hypothetical protein GE09DRAFT_1284194 [Coniochaeta sp. 2T2.1]|nr:hypothetical protein GE09DRAFT_1284194 [Coniochaeta sp. 2T2.1]
MQHLVHSFTSYDNTISFSNTLAFLSVIVLMVPVQAAYPNIVLFNDAEACDLDGPYNMCIAVAENICCYDDNVLYSCAYLDSDDSSRILHVYLSQPEQDDYCAVSLEQAFANVCICPNGLEVISGAKWNHTTSGRDGIDARVEKPCKPVAADGIGARINGTRYVVSNTTDPAGFARIKALRGKVDAATIKEPVYELGTAEE